MTSSSVSPAVPILSPSIYTTSSTLPTTTLPKWNSTIITNATTTTAVAATRSDHHQSMPSPTTKQMNSNLDSRPRSAVNSGTTTTGSSSRLSSHQQHHHTNNSSSNGAPPALNSSVNNQNNGGAVVHPSPSVLQILSNGRELNRASDSVGHHPRIPSLIKLGRESEASWLQIGATSETLGDYDRALSAYESALRHNAFSIVGLSQIANIYRSKEDFRKASEYFGRVVGIAPESGDVWGALGHCYLMIDDLKKAYSSYQQALYYMPNPQEPKLWYGIGILYDRYGSLEHAEEAFSSVIRMDPTFEKANEIFFRLGIIYKQQRKSAQSLECFRYILQNPPRPLTEIDIWFQIGHVYEQQEDFLAAKESYERVLVENSTHAKVLQQLGGLYHRSKAPFYNPELSVSIITKSLESDANDPFSWYLLGRAYMTTNNFGKAYEAYQQAVYRDGKNPAFWCSIGVLYYNINQFHDALDAYSRAIRIYPYLSEVWFNLGALYESCNDQMTDAIDAYQRTLQLDPNNTTVSNRLRDIQAHRVSGTALSTPPTPKDISPTSLSWTYATNSAGPTQLGSETTPPVGRGSPVGTNGNTRLEGGHHSSNSHSNRDHGHSGNGMAAGGMDRGNGSMSGRPRSTDPYRPEHRRRASVTHGNGRGSPLPSNDNSPRVPSQRSNNAQINHDKLHPHESRPSNHPSSAPNEDPHRRHSQTSPRFRHSDLNQINTSSSSSSAVPDHLNYPPPRHDYHAAIAASGPGSFHTASYSRGPPSSFPAGSSSERDGRDSGRERGGNEQEWDRMGGSRNGASGRQNGHPGGRRSPPTSTGPSSNYHHGPPPPMSSSASQQQHTFERYNPPTSNSTSARPPHLNDERPPLSSGRSASPYHLQGSSSSHAHAEYHPDRPLPSSNLSQHDVGSHRYDPITSDERVRQQQSQHRDGPNSSHHHHRSGHHQDPTAAQQHDMSKKRAPTGSSSSTSALASSTMATNALKPVAKSRRTRTEESPRKEPRTVSSATPSATASPNPAAVVATVVKRAPRARRVVKSSKEVESPASTSGSSPGATTPAVDVGGGKPSRREVDEDYDEGVDALMGLSTVRTSVSPQSSRGGGKKNGALSSISSLIAVAASLPDSPPATVVAAVTVVEGEEGTTMMTEDASSKKRSHPLSDVDGKGGHKRLKPTLTVEETKENAAMIEEEVKDAEQESVAAVVDGAIVEKELEVTMSSGTDATSVVV